MKNQVIFLPNNKKEIDSVYQNALKSASEVFILSAYLTDWPYYDVRLNQNCIKFLFIIGTNFGLTRKEACKNVLRWLPSKFKTYFFYNELPGFHPKILLYRLKNVYYLLVGSSNLSHGGFSTNYEVNYHVKLTALEFNQIISWIHHIHLESRAINENWIKTYVEGTIKRKDKQDQFIKSKQDFHSFILSIGNEANRKIKNRRKQLSVFNSISPQFRNLIYACARKKISDLTFYEKHFKLRRDSFFQDIQWVINCKHSEWSIICNSLTKIINAHKEIKDNPRTKIFLLDSIIKDELEYLEEVNHPARKAWLYEVLCQLFPQYYPLINNPIKKWLRKKKISSAFGATEGAKYIDITCKLRELLKDNHRIRNFAELDAIAWNKKNTKYDS